MINNEVMSDKLRLWESVSKTDPAATKTSTQGGRTQTSIDGYWMIRKATEAFGALGIGWGYEVLEERWDNGALIPIKQDDETTRLEQSKTHTIKLKLWFMQNGQRGEVVQYGHTQAIYKSKWGVSDDGEAPKKSLMDAIKKSLSMLGFCSDIFMGKFEDREYVDQLNIEAQLAKQEERASKDESKKAEIAEYVTGKLSAIELCTTAQEVNAIAKSGIRYLSAQSSIVLISDLCNAGINKITLSGNDKKKQLEQSA